MLLVWSGLGACSFAGGSQPDRATAQLEEREWRELFDGVSLDSWTELFGNTGLVEVEQGRLRLRLGTPLSGVRFEGHLPSTNYELALAASREAGSDFFLGLTFPVGASFCTLILGGWGGATCGLSCIDGLDAAQNLTKRYQSFERGRAYEVRLRVLDEAIFVWVDGELWVQLPRATHRFDLRAEVVSSAPLGVSAFATEARIGKIRLRDLNPVP